MSEADLTNKDPDYMINRLFEKEEFMELIDILKKQGNLGSVPHIRAIRTLNKLYVEKLNKESEIYFHYTIKAACLVFGEEETRRVLKQYLRAKWHLETLG